MDNIKDILNKFRCPITLEIFYKAALAEDGHMYEYDIFNEWYKNNETSPLTGLKIGNKITILYDINNMIDEIIVKCPDIEKERYCPNISYISNVVNIQRIIDESNFDELLKYKIYDLKHMDTNNILRCFLKKCSNMDIICHVLDNSININYINNIGNNIVTEACIADNIYAIKYLKQHDFDMTHTSQKDNSNTLHQICLHGSFANVMFIIDEYSEFDIIVNSKSVFDFILQNDVINNGERLMIYKKLFECIKKQGVNEYLKNQRNKQDNEINNLKSMFKGLS